MVRGNRIVRGFALPYNPIVVDETPITRLATDPSGTVRLIGSTPQERAEYISRRVAHESSYPGIDIVEAFPTVMWGSASDSPAMDQYVRYAMNTGDMAAHNARLAELRGNREFLTNRRDELQQAYTVALPNQRPIIRGENSILNRRIDGVETNIASLIEKDAPKLLAKQRWGPGYNKESDEAFYTIHDYRIPKHLQLGQPGLGPLYLDDGTPLTENIDDVMQSVEYSRQSPFGGTFEMRYSGSGFTPNAYGQILPTFRSDRHFTPEEVRARQIALSDRMLIAGTRDDSGIFGQDERMAEIDTNRPELNPRYASGIPGYEQVRLEPSVYLKSFTVEPHTVITYPETRIDIPTGRTVQDPPVRSPYDPAWDGFVQGEGTPLSRLAMGAAPLPPQWGRQNLGDRRYLLGMPVEAPSGGPIAGILAGDRRANTLDPRFAAQIFPVPVRPGDNIDLDLKVQGIVGGVPQVGIQSMMGNNPVYPPYGAQYQKDPNSVIQLTQGLRYVGDIPGSAIRGSVSRAVIPLPPAYQTEVVPLGYQDLSTPATLAFNNELEDVDPLMRGLRPHAYMGFERLSPELSKVTRKPEWVSIPAEEIPSRYMRPPDNYFYENGIVMRHTPLTGELEGMVAPLNDIDRMWMNEFRHAAADYDQALGGVRQAVARINEIGPLDYQNYDQLQANAIKQELRRQYLRDLGVAPSNTSIDSPLDALDHVIVAQRGLTGAEDPALGLYQARANRMGISGDQNIDKGISLTDGLVRTPDGYVRTDITTPMYGARDLGALERVVPAVDPSQGMTAIAAQAKLDLLNKQRATIGLPPFDPRTSNPVEMEVKINAMRNATLNSPRYLPGQEAVVAKARRRQAELDAQAVAQKRAENRALENRQMQWQTAGERLGYEGEEALNVGRYLSTQKIGRTSLDRVDPRIAQAHLASLPPEAIAKIGSQGSLLEEAAFAMRDPNADYYTRMGMSPL